MVTQKYKIIMNLQIKYSYFLVHDIYFIFFYFCHSRNILPNFLCFNHFRAKSIRRCLQREITMILIFILIQNCA